MKINSGEDLQNHMLSDSCLAGLLSVGVEADFNQYYAHIPPSERAWLLFTIVAAAARTKASKEMVEAQDIIKQFAARLKETEPVSELLEFDLMYATGTTLIDPKLIASVAPSFNIAGGSEIRLAGSSNCTTVKQSPEIVKALWRKSRGESAAKTVTFVVVPTGDKAETHVARFSGKASVAGASLCGAGASSAEAFFVDSPGGPHKVTCEGCLEIMATGKLSDGRRW